MIEQVASCDARLKYLKVINQIVIRFSEKRKYSIFEMKNKFTWTTHGENYCMHSFENDYVS